MPRPGDVYCSGIYAVIGAKRFFLATPRELIKKKITTMPRVWRVPMPLNAPFDSETDSSSDDDADDVVKLEDGRPGAILLIPRSQQERYKWPSNWSRKESQFTGTYPVWVLRFGLKEAEWHKVVNQCITVSDCDNAVMRCSDMTNSHGHLFCLFYFVLFSSSRCIDEGKSMESVAGCH